jgi:cytochrome c556
MAASQTAFEAASAGDRDTAKRLTDDLEGQCESCHSLYRREMVTVDLDEVFGPATP